MLSSVFSGPLNVLGGWGWWLATAIAIIFAGSVVPYTVQEIRWALQDERVLEETADPIAVEYVWGSPTAKPRKDWVGGQTFYVRRTICLYKPAVGHVKRWLSDTIRLDLEPTPLSGELYPPYDDNGDPLPLPWCGTRDFPVTLPAAALSPGPIIYKAEIHATLNPRKPDVVIPLRPLTVMISTTPVRQEIEETRQAVRVLNTRLKEADRLIGRLQSYITKLDTYLEQKGSLPSNRPTQPLGGK